MSGRSSCRDCIHDGACNDLPHCLGAYFKSKWMECERCGKLVDTTQVDVGYDNEPLLCERCEVKVEKLKSAVTELKSAEVELENEEFGVEEFRVEELGVNSPTRNSPTRNSRLKGVER